MGTWEIDGSGTAGGLDGGQDVAATAARLAAETRADDAARERARERWLRRQAEGEATFVGMLAGLAERGAVGFDVESGRRLRGRLLVLGADYCVLETIDGDLILPVAAITAARSAPDASAPPDLGDRRVEPTSLLADVLAELADDRPQVSVMVAGGGRVAGVLRAAGRDVMTLQLPGEASMVHLPLVAVREVGLADRW